MAPPSVDHSSDTPAAKRRRIALACNACRLRKSRCDGTRPSCSSCVSLTLNCQYEPGDSAANVIVRKQYISDLESRVYNVEQVVQRLNYFFEGHLSACTTTAGNAVAAARYRPPLNLSPPAPSSPALEETDDGSLPRATGLEEPQDEDATTNGMAMTFVEEHTSAFFGGSSNINFTRLLLKAINHIRNPAQRQGATVDRQHELNETSLAKASRPFTNPVAASPDTGPKSMTTLPPAQEMDRMLDVYFKTAGTVFPFIHEESMRKTYTTCKANNWNRVRRTFLGTLNVIFATIASADRDAIPSARERQEKSDVFFKRATDLCGELSKQVISIEIVQYLVLIVIHCQGSQRSVQAWNILGLAVRSAMALGLHSSQAREGLDELQAEYRRRTWVVIYCMDKVLSVAFGRPAIITDEYMLDQPASLSELALPTPDSPGTSGDIAGDFLAVSFRLYQIMNGSLKQQYSGNINKAESETDDMVSLQASGQLRKQLRAWSAGLPLYMRLYKSKEKMLSDNSQVNRLRVILTLRYHNINILVHRPLLCSTIRRLFDGGDPASVDNSPYLIQLAMGEAHECIRSAQETIELVHTIITADPSGNNNLGVAYFTLYYVFTASLVILGRILWAQHGQGATADEAAMEIYKALLGQVETIFQMLDHENNLVFSCSRYINNMLEVCTAQERTVPVQNDEAGNSSSHQPPSSFAPKQLETMMHLGMGDMDMFQLCSSEIYDSALFQGLDGSSAEAATAGNTEWENSFWAM
ncbi:Zn(II)2Cys6 transcription factor [Fusarium coicis]|nr:Zn(II)2Cys6 transcription factor [Fusarium coicis]